MVHTNRASALKAAKHMAALLGSGFKAKVSKDSAWNSYPTYTAYAQNGMLTVYESSAVGGYYATFGPNGADLELFEQPASVNAKGPQEAAVACMVNATRVVSQLQDMVLGVKLDDAMLLRCAEARTKAQHTTKAQRAKD